MENICVPSIDEIKSNLKFWKDHCNKLNHAIKLIENDIEEIEKRTIAVERIQSLFNEYVLTNNPSKKFNEKEVKILEERLYEYHFDGVSIRYYGRHTWKLDDYDYFVDYSVYIDGKTICYFLKQ